MSKRTKLTKIIFSAFIFLCVAGMVYARIGNLPTWDGVSADCHGTVSPGSGTVVMNSSKGASGITVEPGETFTITIDVVGFIECASSGVVIGFVDGASRADNQLFSWPEGWQEVDLDASGNSLSTAIFTFTAPVVDDDYTVLADVLYGTADGNTAAPIMHISGTFNITVAAPAGAPNYENYTRTNPVNFGMVATISIDAIDISNGSILAAKLIYDGQNYSMIKTTGNTYQFSFDTTAFGPQNFTYTILLIDELGERYIINPFEDCFIVIEDNIPPVPTGLTETPSSVSVGEPVVISISASDNAGISSVVIEIDGTNHSMTYNASGDFYYISWISTSVGVLDYSIHVEDDGGNIVTVTDSVEITNMGMGGTAVGGFEGFLNSLLLWFSDDGVWLYMQFAIFALLVGIGVGKIARARQNRDDELTDLAIEALQKEIMKYKKTGKNPNYE